MGNDNQDPFKIIGGGQAMPPQYGESVQAEAGEINQRIQKLIDSSDIFIFMKGTPDFPQCGFSANTVAIFNAFQKNFKTFDVLSDPSIRQGIKEFSS